MNKRYERDYENRDWSRMERDRDRDEGRDFRDQERDRDWNRSERWGASDWNLRDRDFDRDRGLGRDTHRDMGRGMQRDISGGQRDRSLGQRIGEKVRRFFGKGPKGYKRSDDRIREDVCDVLSEGWIDASDIEVRVSDSEVTLIGFVTDR